MNFRTSLSMSGVKTPLPERGSDGSPLCGGGGGGGGGAIEPAPGGETRCQLEMRLTGGRAKGGGGGGWPSMSGD